MDVVLWILQIALCVKLVTVAYTHGLRVNQPKIQQGVQKMGTVAIPLLTLVSICALLVGFGSVLPAALGTLAWLTPWAAALLGVMMLLSIGLHIACRETPNVWASLVICAIAAIVAYGRWVLVPF